MREPPAPRETSSACDLIEAYLDRVMRHANLAPADRRDVRAELREHLCELAEARPAEFDNPKEALMTLNDEFGDPKSLGLSIASSKGKFRTFLKKKARKLVIGTAAVLALVFAARASVVEAFYVAGDGVSPVITRGSRCLVYKFSPTFVPADVVVYKPVENPGADYLAIVKGVNPQTGDLLVTRKNGVEFTVPRKDVVGRVVASTRHANGQ